VVQAFQPPDGLLAKSQGSTQLLSNGNALVNWGSEGAVTEFRADGTPIFHAYMDSGALGEGVENYRAFKYNWTGIPNEEPSLVAEKTPSGTSVYVSWNGDTETAIWRFYAVTDRFGSRSFLGEVPRDGFETAFHVSGHSYGQIAAEAISGQGKVLRATETVRLREQVVPGQGVGQGQGQGQGAGVAEVPDRASWRQIVLRA
jgi:hypothetical protein